MSLTARVLIGLVAGLALGILVSATGSPVLATAADWIAPVGTLWINAIRMTVIPLVVATLVAGVMAAPDARAVGRIGGRALVLFLVILSGAALFSVVVGPPVMAALPIGTEAAAALRASTAAAGAAAAASADAIPTLEEWLIGLVPTNPVRAAADGALLPLILFSVAFGLAATRVAGARRRTLADAVAAVGDAMLVLVRWILAAAPVGVFALAVPLATTLGLAAAGAVAYYVAAVSLMCIAYMGVLYLLGVVAGGMAPGRFAKGSAPAQAVAFSSRSSLASLPAMIEGAEDVLRVPSRITSFFLPLAASTFRTGGAIGIPVGVLLIARLYGIELEAAQLATVAVASVLTTFSVPGVPGGSIIVMVPVLLAVGLPPEGIGLLLGVDTIPDMFRTTTNVTGDMAAVTVLSRWDGAGDEAEEVREEAVAAGGA